MIVVFVVVLALVIGGGVVLLARDRARILIYPARNPVTTTPADMGIPNYEAVTFRSADGIDLQGWFLPPTSAADGAVIVYVHGLASNRAGLLGQAVITHRVGYGALLFDLRNHGESGGTQTTLGFEEPRDVIAAVEYLKTRSDVNPARIVLAGESLGGATVLRAMSSLPDVVGVVAECAYSSIEENIAEGVERITGLPPFPFAPLIIFFGQQETGARISDVRPIDDVIRLAPRPVLFMHGDQDTLIDVSNSRRMFAAAGEPKQLVIFPGAIHGGLHQQDAALFTDSLLAFLDTYLPIAG